MVEGGTETGEPAMIRLDASSKDHRVELMDAADQAMDFTCVEEGMLKDDGGVPTPDANDAGLTLWDDADDAGGLGFIEAGEDGIGGGHEGIEVGGEIWEQTPDGLGLNDTSRDAHAAKTFSLPWLPSSLRQIMSPLGSWH